MSEATPPGPGIRTLTADQRRELVQLILSGRWRLLGSRPAGEPPRG